MGEHRFGNALCPVAKKIGLAHKTKPRVQREAGWKPAPRASLAQPVRYCRISRERDNGGVKDDSFRPMNRTRAGETPTLRRGRDA